MAALVELPTEVATPCERSRFLIANKGDVDKSDKALSEYLEWREEYLPRAQSLSEENITASRWWGFLQQDDGQILRSSRNKRSRVVLACGGFNLCGTGCDDGTEVPVQTTVAAMSNWLDNCLSRDSKEKITLLVDVRPRDGWPNPTPTSLLPLIRQLSSVFGAMNPERLEACVIFPMPWVVMATWYIVKLFMDPKTASKIVFLAGSSYEGAPLPEGLSEYIDENLLTMDRFFGGKGGVVAPTEKGENEEEEEEEEDDKEGEDDEDGAEEEALVF
jgi:hypothetical protein